MRCEKWVRVVLFGVGAAVLVCGQEPGRPPVNKWNGYGYYSDGRTTAKWGSAGMPAGFGGGAEAFLYRGLAVGADLGYQGETQCGLDCSIGLFNAGLSYDFIHPTKRKAFDPFVTFGGGFGFGPGDPGGIVSAGGGVNWRFKPRAGLRTEFRANAFAAGDAGLALVRAGLVFR